VEVVPEPDVDPLEVDPLGGVPLGAPAGGVPVAMCGHLWVVVVLPEELVSLEELEPEEAVDFFELVLLEAAVVLVELVLLEAAVEAAVVLAAAVEVAVEPVVDDAPVAAFAATAPPTTRPAVRAAAPIMVRTRIFMCCSFRCPGRVAVPTARWLLPACGPPLWPPREPSVRPVRIR
jgi:hypothetical protein